MKRRKFMQNAFWLAPLSMGTSSILNFTDKLVTANPPFKRVRPGDSNWPSPAQWEQLSASVNGNLIKVESPLAACRQTAEPETCNELFRELKNPYYIGDSPALTQTSGWLNAWQSEPSVYAVHAKSTADISMAIKFAKKYHLRLVVKGGGHSYQGTSNCKDSLMIWTRALNTIEIKDDFVAEGSGQTSKPQHAVTVGAGAIWHQAYDAVTTNAGRYVQGGGCMTVGVSGLILGGGFGSFSKNYGLAAAALLEAEIVTADGDIKIVNAIKYPDLFWALKGGGGGSFGVVTKLTLKTRELPKNFGVLFGKIKANSDSAFKKLIKTFIVFYKEQLFNPHWGEQARFRSDNSLEFTMLSHGMTKAEMQSVWQSFEDQIKSDTENYSFENPLTIAELPARQLWNAAFLKKYAASLVGSDDRPNAPEGNIFWADNKGECGQYLYAYHSAWLPETLLEKPNQVNLTESIFSATRFWECSLHFNKGLAGSPPEEIEAAQNTATNPEVLKAFALVIIAASDQPAFKGIADHEPDIKEGTDASEKIERAMEEMLKAAPGAGSYLNESNFFEKNWQKSFWGSNYSRLAGIKKKYDPEGLFFVHHGVGSEAWSSDGFEKIPV